MGSYDYNLVKFAVAPAVRTNGTTTSAAVDLSARGGVQYAGLFVVTGTITDGTHTVTVEESTDGSSGWTAVSLSGSRARGSIGTAGALTSAESNTMFEAQVETSKQYIRMVLTVTGATSGGAVAGGFILAGNRFGAR